MSTLCEAAALDAFIGCRYTETFTWTDDAGVAINITGYTASFSMIRDHSDEDDVLTVALNIGGSNGVFTLVLTEAQTALLEGSYIYSIVITPPAGEKEHFISGTITLHPVVLEKTPTP